LDEKSGWLTPASEDTVSAFQYITSPTSSSSTGLDAGPGGSGSYYQTEVNREVTVSAGSKPAEVSWSLDCDRLNYPITGGADYLSTPAIPTGACSLTMTDSGGDGWDGAEWSAPGLGPFSLASGSSGVATFTVRPASFALSFDSFRSQQCGAAVSTVSFQYHMFGSASKMFTGDSDTGTLSLKSAEGATLWTKTGAQPGQAADSTGWKDVETVPVNSPSFHFEYVPPPPAFVAQPVVVMVYRAGETSQKVQTGTANVTAGVTYDIKTEILRNGLGSASERVTKISVDGHQLGGCNPNGKDDDCTFFDCFSPQSRSVTATSDQLQFELNYVGHSWACDCDTTTWESGDESCSPKEDTVAGRTSMTAVARFTLTPQMPSWATAAVAQMQVCCPPAESSSTTTFVHHSVPHSFADMGACLHTEGPPLTIREDGTSTVSATLTPPRDSNRLVC